MTKLFFPLLLVAALGCGDEPEKPSLLQEDLRRAAEKFCTSEDTHDWVLLGDGRKRCIRANCGELRFVGDDIDTVQGSEVYERAEHPNQWYIKEIVVDTPGCSWEHVDMGMPETRGLIIASYRTHKFIISTDTTWAKKRQVWLEPEQWKRLQKLLEKE